MALEMTVDSGQVRVRLPSNEKAKEVVAKVIDLIEREKKAQYAQHEVSVGEFTPEFRSRFFIRLMTAMDGFRPETVTRLKVSSSAADDADADGEVVDEDDADAASSEMLHLVENVALAGENLLVSEQYRQLTESGFFITSMTWRAVQKQEPRDKVLFEVSFEDGKHGSGFRYLVRVAEISRRETYPQNFKSPADGKKRQLFNLIEKTARETITALRADLPRGGGDA